MNEWNTEHWTRRSRRHKQQTVKYLNFETRQFDDAVNMVFYGQFSIYFKV